MYVYVNHNFLCIDLVNAIEKIHASKNVHEAKKRRGSYWSLGKNRRRNHARVVRFAMAAFLPDYVEKHLGCVVAIVAQNPNLQRNRNFRVTRLRSIVLTSY